MFSLTALMIPGVVFLVVCVVVGVLAFVFRENTPKAATRLDMLVGKRRKEDDQQADILRKTAFENDKKSLIEMLKKVELMSPAIRATGEESFEMVVPAMKIRDFYFSEVTKF